MKTISLFSGYIYLIIAIITGIASNGFLKTTESFTKLTPTIFCILSIVVCIFCLSKAMTIIPVGFTYATYGALTITAVTLFGIFKYNQTPNLYGTLGLLLIIAGVILLNIFGKVNKTLGRNYFSNLTPLYILFVVAFFLFKENGGQLK